MFPLICFKWVLILSLKSKEFFNSPTEVKQTCAVGSGESGKNSGWFGMNAETLDPDKQKRGDFKEHVYTVNDLVLIPTNAVQSVQHERIQRRESAAANASAARVQPRPSRPVLETLSEAVSTCLGTVRDRTPDRRRGWWPKFLPSLS